MAKAMLAAGSFWTAEAAFHRVPGVRRTTVGYSGGHVPNSTYDQVVAGGTGHAEVVLIDYDPERVSYRRLLDVFWEVHDPKEYGEPRSGPSHQCSIIFYFNGDQFRTAEACLRRQQKGRGDARPIGTRIAPAGSFYAAEERYQQYLEKRGLMARSLFGR